MSEVQQKPVEETVLAPMAATEELNAPATEATVDPIRPTGTDTLVPESRPEVTPAADTTAGHDNGAAVAGLTDDKLGPNETTVTAQPIAEGILGYKAPGLIKSLRFSKKFFWLGHDSVEPQHLSSYLRGEKQDVAHPNIAHASQTGKGLLFFSKRVEDKAQPAGILNLAEASDVTKEGYNEFSFRIHGQRHTFEAPTHAERDSWLVALEKQITEAKASREGIVGSDGYKHHLENLGKPSTLVAAPAANSRSRSAPAKKSIDEKVTDSARNGDAIVSSNSSSADESATKRKTKSRSQSRKRASIFGSLLGGKKEEHDEKKELKKEEKAEVKAEKEERKEEKMIHGESLKAATDEPKDGVAGTSLEAEAIAARVVNAPEVPGDEILPTPVADIVQPAPTAVETTAPSSTTREHAPKPNKRNSLFGSLFNKVSSPSHEKTEKEVGPTVPMKEPETAPVSAVAPQLADPVDATVSKPVPTSNEADAVIPGPSNTRHTLTSSSPPKGGIFAFMKGKDARSEEKKEIKAEERGEKKAEEPVLATGTPTVPGSGAPAPITSTNGNVETSAEGTTGTGSPTTPDAVKEKRRTSLFGTLSGKKDRATEVTGESGATDGETKQKPASSGMLGSLFRRPSRAARGEKEVSKKHTASPTTVDESNKPSTPINETPTTETEPTTTMHETSTESQANGVAPTQSVPVQAAA